MAVAGRAAWESWSFLKSVREGVFTVPGDGDINFDAVFGQLERGMKDGF